MISTPCNLINSLQDNPEFPEDIDYKMDLNDISIRWGGFEEAQSIIEYYEVGFGTEPGLSDVWPMEHVSTNTCKCYSFVQSLLNSILA